MSGTQTIALLKKAMRIGTKVKRAITSRSRSPNQKTYKVPEGRVDEFIAIFRHNLGHLLAKDMAKNCAVDTGDLKNSIRYLESEDGLKFLMDYHAWYVEFPTAEHEIRAKNAPNLVFRARDGNLVVTPRVMHPGTDSQPFIRPAFFRIQEFSDKAARMTLRNMGVA
jgi:hypothetical protein